MYPFELTVHTDFTLPDGGAGRRFTKSEPVTDPALVAQILASEFHVNVTKVPAGTHVRIEPEPAPKARKAKGEEPAA